MLDPALAPLAHVARALSDLRQRVVFIGGAIAPLLQTDPPFDRPRPTFDVDAIAATAGYGDFAALQAMLRARGFRENVGGRHAHRWWAPGEPPVQFDLVPAGTHLGAGGNPWDAAALATAVEAEIEPGLVIRHASAPGFLALKLAAFRDRGGADPFTSHDLEDVLALLASRPGVDGETAAAPGEIRSFVAARAAALAARDDLDDLLAGHLGNVGRARAAEAIGRAREALERLARLSRE